jgi:hypothetical protein
MTHSLRVGAFAAILAATGLATPSLAAITQTGASATVAKQTESGGFVLARRGGGGGRGGMAGHRGGGAMVAHRGGGGHANVNRNRNVSVNRNVNRNVNVHGRVGVVGVRPVRGWVRRPYYGTIVGGVALGTVIAVTAVGAAPVAPTANMCWFWADASQMRGYWDYCVAP